MDSGLLFSLLDQCAEMGIEAVTFSGGEPMLHPAFLPALQKSVEYGLRISVFSNLTLLHDEIIPALKTKQIREIQASLYSVEPGIHDSITRLPGSCEKTKAALTRLAQEGVPVFVSCPVMKQNKASYAGVVQWAKSIGASSSPNIAIMARSDRSSDNLENRLTIDEALRVIADILENDPGAYARERFAPGYNNQDEALPCVQSICKSWLCVNAAGFVLPSPAWNYVLGDLHTQSLSGIWENSPKVKRLRGISLDDFPKCRNCPDIQFCGMSLEANANETPGGDPFIIPPQTCELARRTGKKVRAWLNSFNQ
jgi:MoaA/NifB/PqqE/SkfB family radical SAM enzyme